MPSFFRPHILLQGRTDTLPYTSNQSGRSKVKPRDINPRRQGKNVRQNFKKAVEEFSAGEDLEFVYVTFLSEPDFYLDIDKLSDSKGNFRLASYKEIRTVDDEGNEHLQIEATVCLNKKAVSQFLKKVDQYIKERTQKNNPKNRSLMANISVIQAATLQSFWQEPELPFPAVDQAQWWEVWLSRSNEGVLNTENFAALLGDEDVTIGPRELVFPEHQVFLVRASANQLSNTLLYTDRLSELRKPRETAAFFLRLNRDETMQVINNIIDRVLNLKEQQNISICLLDTGVNRNHPLLANLIAEHELDSVIPAWTKADTHPQGHGTPMAALIFFGDLVDAFTSNGEIPVFHYLESIKLIESGQPHDPDLYGAVTQEGVARGVIIHPHNKRIVCMTVTSDALDHRGRPSSWSSAIDQLLYNSLTDENASETMFFVSSGNVESIHWLNYPIINDEISAHDPAQAFNAITVGAYTLKETFDKNQFPNAELLAKRGGMSPCNSTSVTWHSEWCKKPDIVMEGCNAAIDNNAVMDIESLQMLSAGKGGFNGHLLTTFGDTSGATALASKFAAELWFQYPQYWSETIRALIIHSANWTPAMLGNRRIDQLTPDEKRNLLSRVGYGVPNMQRAKQSANNVLTLIAERTLTPYKKEDGRIKTDKFHLFDLPWPVDALDQLFETQVVLVVTLSYFIEPNPGERQYQKSASYRSYGLRFKMIDRAESLRAFKARVSKAIRDEEYSEENNEQYQKEGGEHWILGGQLRDKGSIHKDLWKGTAAELSTRNKIAVYPVGGWWKYLKKQNRFESSLRYSIAMSIITPDIDVDIYTPVYNQVTIPVEINSI